MLYLQACTSADAQSYEHYAEKITGALAKTVEQSFAPEFRRIQIALGMLVHGKLKSVNVFVGLVDVIAELFILEVEVFGYSVVTHQLNLNHLANNV